MGVCKDHGEKTTLVEKLTKKKKFKDVAEEQGKRYRKENLKMTFKRFFCVYDESKIALKKKFSLLFNIEHQSLSHI